MVLPLLAGDTVTRNPKRRLFRPQLAVLTALPTRLNVPLALMHTTMIRASMTAYSTAVGPSSPARKRWTELSHCRIRLPLSHARAPRGARPGRASSTTSMRKGGGSPGEAPGVEERGVYQGG